jgi:hypothetical protein
MSSDERPENKSKRPYVRRKNKEPDQGALYKKAFTMIREGKELWEIVEALSVTPDFVRRAKAERDAGFNLPPIAAVLSPRERAQQAALLKKEAIEKVKLEAVETQERSKTDRIGLMEETERAKAHARTMEAINGGRKP